MVVDQFEELFTLCDDAARAARSSTRCSRCPGPVVDRPARRPLRPARAPTPASPRAVAGNQILLGAMTAAELQRAVTEPARLAGLRLEPGLVDLVLRDVAGEPGALPLLSHALRATWERRDGRTLTVEAYRESGGVASALARTADDARRRAARRTGARSSATCSCGSPSSARASRTRGGACAIDELVPEGASPDAVQRCSTARRRPAADPRRGHRRGRPRGAASASGRRCAAGSTRTARASACTGGSATPPGSGTPAAASPPTSTAAPGSTAALDWARATPDELNATERAFLDAESREAGQRDAERQRRANRRLRGLLAGTAVLLVLALVAGVVAFSSAARPGTRR